LKAKIIYGIKYGKNLKVNGRIFIKVNRKGAISIGDNFILNSRFSSNLVGITNHAALQCIGIGKILIGDSCGFTSPVFSSRKLIQIGNNVKLGGNVRLFDHDYHSLDYLNRRLVKSDSDNVKSSPILIGHDVFIGTNCIILKGVTIGEKSIIGTGSVVTKDIPPNVIAAGNPCKVIKQIE